VQANSGAPIRSRPKGVAGSKRVLSRLRCMPCFDRACRSESGLLDGSLGTIFVFLPELLPAHLPKLSKQGVSVPFDVILPVISKRFHQLIQNGPIASYIQTFYVRDGQEVAS
jgi:hypothetical protein